MTTRFYPSLVLVPVAAAAMLSGCGDDGAQAPALDVQLVPDLNLNGVAQIAGAIDSVRVVVDSPQGLYPPGSESVTGNVEVRDEDNDPSDLELVATVPVPSGRLPLLRLERGGLPDVPLDIRFIGYASSEPSVRVAEGIVRGIRFEPDGVRSLSVPFNMRPELLPPRVVEVQPADGTYLKPCQLDTMVVVFSKPIEAATLLAPGNFTVDQDPVPASIVLDASGYVATYAVGVPFVRQTRSYRVKISTKVRSRDGLALDQVAAEPGAQPYDTPFTITCDGQDPALTPDPCIPETGSTGSCPGDGRFTCMDGSCVPVACNSSSCVDPFVCDPVSSRCEVDCRVYGELSVCPEERPECEEASGVCVAGS